MLLYHMKNDWILIMTRKQKLLLGVNVDHIATLRQARGTTYPDPVEMALIAEEHGADSITVHLREDRRHIQDRDVERLVRLTRTRVNLEMALSREMIDFACSIKPSDCCLVPEKREELTTEGGLNVMDQIDPLSQASAKLKKSGIRVAFFVDPDPRQIESSQLGGAEVVELHTGNYADAVNDNDQEDELNRIIECAIHGTRIGLKVHAGHGLNYENTAPIASIEEILELNIGHAIVAKSVDLGMAKAISSLKKIMMDAR